MGVLIAYGIGFLIIYFIYRSYKINKTNKACANIWRALSLFLADIHSYFNGDITEERFLEILDSWSQNSDFAAFAFSYKAVVTANNMKNKSNNDKSADFIIILNYITFSQKTILEWKKMIVPYLNDKTLAPEIARLVETEYSLLLLFEPVTQYFMAHLCPYPTNLNILKSLTYNDECLIDVLKFLFGCDIAESIFNKHIEEKAKYFIENRDKEKMTVPDFSRI